MQWSKGGRTLLLLLLASVLLFLLWSQASSGQLSASYGYLLKSEVAVEEAVTLLLDADSPNATLADVWNVTSFSEPALNASVERCAEKPAGLVGPVRVWLDAPSMDALDRLYDWLEPGGHGFPAHCRPRFRVAIVVPYRERETQLHIFLHNMHSFLRKQELDYGIFIVEQVANQTFNRAKLMNVGYTVANKLYDWQCYAFHDVDLLPEDDRNIYSCPDQPRHMSVAVDKFGYKLPYGSIFGGVSAMTKHQFSKMNGFSNSYWGWGGEDDDISARVVYAGYKITRYPLNIAKYKMVKHSTEKLNPVNPCRFAIMGKTRSRWRADGLNSLKFKLVGLELERTHTHILVDLLEAEERAKMDGALRKCKELKSKTKSR